jgi:membrane dipeptidase
MYRLGARYMTLTHNCDNAFATSASTVAAGGPDSELTEVGAAAVREMNLLGMLVDLSLVSHQTMRECAGNCTGACYIQSLGRI